MIIDRNEKKKEAIRRMESIGVFQPAIDLFRKKDTVCVSVPPIGSFVRADWEDMERIREIEDKYDALVYMVVRDFSNIGKTDSYLVVSDYKEEWDMDREDLGCERTCAYVYNYDYPEFSEFGSIGFELTAAEGLVRTW
ncbi:MAG: hypothetical protein NC489_31710 [Ruminococcus flavefaciens]|nr:hypothetical protein [Ruminococcus flavefaciens]